METRLDPTMKGYPGCLTVVGLLLVWVWMLSSCSPDPEEAAERRASELRILAWNACKEAVKTQLRAPSTAKFKFAGWTGVQNIPGDDRYLADSWVDAENAFGAMIRTDFKCLVRIGAGENYEIVALEMGEQ